jgi:hypothetical protein
MRAENAPARFPSVLRVRGPRGLPQAIDAAARRRHTTGAQWMREALLAHLEAEGWRLGPDGQVEALDAGRPA